MCFTLSEMSANSSQPLNESDLQQLSSSKPDYISCLLSKPSRFIFIPFTITSILFLVPLCAFVFYHGLLHWHQRTSNFSAARMSHFDYFTYNLVSMEVVVVVGWAFSCYGAFTGQRDAVSVGNVLYYLSWYGEILFHNLTCIERYMAVVHPITYLGLKQERGLRIRNIIVGCVWLLCLLGMTLSIIGNFVVMDLLLMFLSLPVAFFCNISVLVFLIRPGPGEQIGAWERVDQGKKKAFHTITILLVVLMLRFSGDVIYEVFYLSGGMLNCIFVSCSFWLCLPSSLVLPLLFLFSKTEKLFS